MLHILRRTVPRWELALIGLIVVLAMVLRFVQLPDRMAFRDDEGRDARIVRTMLLSGQPVLEGPPTSVKTSAGVFTQGPLTYYFFAPALLLANFSPVGPAALTVLFSVGTIALLWWVGRTWFHPIAGLVASSTYAFSPLAITESQHAWNPNLVPFFALTAIAGAVAAWRRGTRVGILVAFASLAAAIQFHSSAAVVGFPVAIALVLCLRKYGRKVFTPFLYGIGLVILISTPMIIREIRDGFPSVDILRAYFQTPVEQTRNWSHEFSEVRVHFAFTVNGIIAAGKAYARVMAALSVFALITVMTKRRWRELELLALVFIPWVAMTAVSIIVYREPVFSHYLTHVWPLVALGWGWVAWQLSRIVPRYSVAIIIPLVLCTLTLSIINSPLRSAAPFELRQAQQIAAEITARTRSQNVSLIRAEPKQTADAVAYVLERRGRIVSNALVTDDSFIVCLQQNCAVDVPADYYVLEKFSVPTTATVFWVKLRR